MCECLARWMRSAYEDEIFVINNALTYDILIDINPVIVVSYSYKHIIPLNILRGCGARFINLHISFLPFNRGADPNVWSFLDGTICGVTVHYMTEQVDCGPILLQEAIFFSEESETLASSYLVLHNKIQSLFKTNWGKIRAEEIESNPQLESGTIHYAKEFSSIKDLLLKDDGWDVTISILKQRYRDLMNEKCSS